MRHVSRILSATLLAAALTLPAMAQGNPQSAPTGATNSAARSGGQYDQQIQQEVTNELKKHDWAKDVRASVEDGIVTLQGTVPVYLDKARAYDKIHNKDHVQGVRNQIVVAGQTVPDQQLGTKIADKLRYDRMGQGITFNNFNLNVKDGVVTISGEARSPVDAESALAIVETTPGVKDVVDDIKILPTSFSDDEARLAVARAVYGYGPLQKYAMDPQRPIRIIVDRGNVTLYGVVDTPQDKTMAELQAKSVPGIFSVTDKLMVANQQVK